MPITGEGANLIRALFESLDNGFPFVASEAEDVARAVHTEMLEKGEARWFITAKRIQEVAQSVPPFERKFSTEKRASDFVLCAFKLRLRRARRK